MGFQLFFKWRYPGTFVERQIGDLISWLVLRGAGRLTYDVSGCAGCDDYKRLLAKVRPEAVFGLR
jgi:hypothetical protein